MTRDYGTRYLTVDRFVSYCEDLNVKTDKQELEHYEKAGIMLPVARLMYPENFVRLKALYTSGATNEPPELDQWPELQRLFDKSRILPEDYADLRDDELIDSFDREMGKNPYLSRPTPETYQPWDSYRVLVPYQDGHQFSHSTAEHYYSYWQVHQLFYIQQYPYLYKDRELLKHIPDEVKSRISRPWAPAEDQLRGFKGLARMFDALSFWITIYENEHKRTFARVQEKHWVKRLDAPQLQAYRGRLIADAKLVQTTHNITVDDSYEFLYQLIELYSDYQKKERHKLTEELRSDIFYATDLIEAASGSEWEVIAEELGKRYPPWTKQSFRHLDILTKEHDEARDLLTLYARKYSDTLSELKIPAPTHSFSTTEIDELLDYCEREGLSVLITALSGLIATKEEYATKFRRVAKYTNLKNVLTALEFLLKDFAGKGSIIINKPTLNPTIQSVLKNETAWMPLFETKTGAGFTSAKNPTDFFTNLNQLVHDPRLVQSEDTYWARVFLIASLARNLTVHVYPNDDWFYGELFGEMLLAAIYAILYSWQVAKREGWT